MITRVQIMGFCGTALLRTDNDVWHILKEGMDNYRSIMPLDNVNVLEGRIIEISKEKMDLDWIKKALALEIKKVRALNSAVAGTDRELENDIRTLSIIETEDMLNGPKGKNILRFLRKQFLPVPCVGADITGAIEIAAEKNCNKLWHLYLSYSNRWRIKTREETASG